MNRVKRTRKWIAGGLGLTIKVTKAEMLARIDALLPLRDGHVDYRAEPEHVLKGAFTVMNEAYGVDSHQVSAVGRK